jgi:pimeloyl-ACP methyl ester carboxylesterase
MTKELNSVRYWTYHDTAAPVCIFIHGFTGSHEGYQYIIPELQRFQIIVPDLPGFGESELSLGEFRIDALAHKVNDFVRALNLKTPP